VTKIALDNEDHLIDYITMMTVQEQARKFMTEIQTRRRAPVKAATQKAYRSHIDHWIVPLLGKRDLAEVENGVVKNFLTCLCSRKPATINAIFMTLKMVIASAVDENGNQLYPRTWNADFIDLPVVVPSEQDAPTVTPDAIQVAISRAQGADKALYALLAGSGLRIGEALSLKVGIPDDSASIWYPSANLIVVRTTLSGGKIQNSTKTLAGQRQIDLHPDLNEYIREKASVQKAGLIFPSQTGGLACIKTCYQRLAKAGITEGFHAFRRFRITHLESVGVPRGLAMFWTGHGAKDVHESYIKMSKNLEVRKDWAKKAGLGFKLEVL
jgi:integrase